jgi:hypothetical protein
MPLIVEDGTGRTNADAYVSVAEADAYFLARNTAWAGYSNDAREAAIRFATSWLDDTYLGLWKGARASEFQSLAWPRDNSPGYTLMWQRGAYPKAQGYLYDLDGYPVMPNVVPRAVKRACMEAAILKAQGVDFAKAATTTAVRKASRSVDRVSYSDEYEAAVSKRDARIQAIDNLLLGLVTSKPGASFATVKMVRA